MTDRTIMTEESIELMDKLLAKDSKAHPDRKNTQIDRDWLLEQHNIQCNGHSSDNPYGCEYYGSTLTSAGKLQKVGLNLLSLEQQLQAKDEEIKELNEKIGKDNVVDYHYHRKREFELLKEIEELKNKENRSDGIIGGLLNEGKSLQTKLQQAKEGLELADKVIDGAMRHTPHKENWVKDYNTGLMVVELVKLLTKWRETLNEINKE